jgi:hypothetical protein
MRWVAAKLWHPLVGCCCSPPLGAEYPGVPGKVQVSAPAGKLGSGLPAVELSCLNNGRKLPAHGVEGELNNSVMPGAVAAAPGKEFTPRLFNMSLSVL